MRYCFPPPPPPTLAIAGRDEKLPVQRIWCVGRNYADHAREMGGAPEREPPFFFAKSAHALADPGQPIAYPPMTRDWQHEVELVVALAMGGSDIAEADAKAHILGYAVGLDMTRRDLQAEAKRAGRPWDMAKNHDAAAVAGALALASTVGHPSAGIIRLEVNGTERQRGDLADMSWTVPAILAELSRYVRLLPGDLIYTGTPAGVGPVGRGDRLVATIEGLPALDVVVG